MTIDSVTAGYTMDGRVLVALRDVSFSVKYGEIVGLIGPNGSGKTTVIRIATGVLDAMSGSVLLGERNITDYKPTEIARLVSVVPQEPTLPAGFTALECVMMGRSPHLRLLENETERDVEVCRRSMHATDIWQLADRRVGELSGGERQRVVVARALAQETPVILLDEPTAHLDIGHQASVLRLVRRVAREDGKAVLAVVHDLTLAAQMCDRLVLLSNGTIVASGRPHEVLTPGRIRSVYGAAVEVLQHPRTGGLVIAPSLGPP